MKPKTNFTKRDPITGLLSTVFLLASLGAVGAHGRRRAKEVVCLSNLQKWGHVWKAFVDDHDAGFVETLNWIEPLEPYYKNRKLLLCPEAAKPAIPPEPPTLVPGGKFNAWIYWAGELDDQLYLGSYGLNQWVMDVQDGGREVQNLWRTPYVTAASHAPLMLDAARDGLTPLFYDEPPAYDGQIYYPPPSNINEIRSCCLNRHNAAVNALFLDFSARKIGLKELWKLKWHRNWPEDAPLPVWPLWMINFKDF